MVKRDGDDPEADIRADEFLNKHKERFCVIEAPEGMAGISSSAVRDEMRMGGDGAKEMCHPKVWQMLLENGRVGLPIVHSFREEYQFLSNFWEAPVIYEGLTYGSNEAAFQAQKCMTDEERLPFTEMNPGQSKREGRRVQLRPDWDQVKVGLMEEIVRAKFTQNEDLKAMLLATGALTLEEGNTWHDVFWGVDAKTREGQNHLGRILMQVRKELQES